MKKVLMPLFMAVLSVVAVCAGAKESINWNHKALTAGKASLVADSYIIERTLGTPNFSPEFRMPLQLVYESGNGKFGLFGYAWRSPQLESRVFPRRDGAEWVSPWGEKIRFFNRSEITKDSLEIYQEQAKGKRGCFSPYSDWEAAGADGNWKISGMKDFKGWIFEYSDSFLTKINAPSGRSLVFRYTKGKLSTICENGLQLAAFEYNSAGRVASAEINGVKYKLDYTEVNAQELSNQIALSPVSSTRQMLGSVQMGTLAAEKYSYDAYGYLAGIQRGDYSETLAVQHETLKERNDYFERREQAKKDKKPLKNVARAKVSGRLLQDKNFKYSYDNHPYKVMISNKSGHRATYAYDQQSGILDITDFAGLNTKIYYFRRYDVAYNGKLRQVVDAQGRVAVSYKYDSKTGNILRTRDMADNETYFNYDKNGNLIRVARSEDGFSGERPLVSLKYDKNGNPVIIAKLDRSGKEVWDTRLVYNNFNEVTSVATAEGRTAIRYNQSGLISQITDAFNLTTTRHYDKFNRVSDVIAPNGTCVSYEYDANGQIVSIKRYATMHKQQMLSSVKFDYDATGQVFAVTDNQGRTRKFDRDAEGQVIKEYFPDNTAVGYAYTKLGQLNRTVDPNGHKIAFKWNKFGKLDTLITAVGQKAEYEYDKFGLLIGLKNTWKKQTDRDVKYTYNKLDRLEKIDFGSGKSKTFTYDRLGKVTEITAIDGDSVKTEIFNYTEFDQLYQKIATETVNGKITSKLIYEYSYLPNGKRRQMLILYPDGQKSRTVWNYDMHGRLAQIDDNGKLVTYKYNSKNQLTEQVINGIPVYYAYTQFGQLEGKYMGSKERAIAFLKYTYDNDGMITARNVNGANQLYTYDLKGQLTSVTQDGKVVEQYTYDPAGNILKKVVAGKTTEFTYDAANQLASMTENSGEAGNNAVRRTDFAYDAAGRMTQQIHGEAGTDALRRTEYAYGWMNKVMSISENGKVSATYDYHVDGQVAKRLGSDGKAQNFFWDGLALIRRGETNLTNEPYVTGGNPIIANGATLFNDILGTTQGATDGKEFSQITRDSFGQTLDNSTDTNYDYFTGKPKIEGLGYAFLFRNYAAGLGKWTTSDPLGYPDGWNNFAYVNNGVIGAIDKLGADITHLVDPNGAVFGAGHSAWIIGNDTIGYTAYDYRPEGSSSSSGSSSNGGSPAVKTFNNFGAALDYLNSGRDAGHQYTQGQTLYTTNADDAVANTAATQYMTESYGLFAHNCYQLGNYAVGQVNQQNGTTYNISTNIQPNNAFQDNQDNLKIWHQTAVVSE